MEPSPKVYWSPTTDEGNSHLTLPDRDFAVIKKPLVSSLSLSLTFPETELASMKSAFPLMSTSTEPEEDDADTLPIFSTNRQTFSRS